MWSLKLSGITGLTDWVLQPPGSVTWIWCEQGALTYLPEDNQIGLFRRRPNEASMHYKFNKTDSLNAIIHDITRSILMIGVVIYFFWFETLTINWLKTIYTGNVWKILLMHNVIRTRNHNFGSQHFKFCQLTWESLQLNPEIIIEY